MSLISSFSLSRSLSVFIGYHFLHVQCSCIYWVPAAAATAAAAASLCGLKKNYLLWVLSLLWVSDNYIIYFVNWHLVARFVMIKYHLL
ncbi:hypothetical protein Pint_27073 [Pistacia integerrima]|uniref:Uncharacterized protein n=1 Tax=Pistacia integerrima TaxID=434235 RepID=A0ACC0YNF0_9ROSI|nr:hypothetical protein Pint_27073 [Pistacia integerrima]